MAKKKTDFHNLAVEQGRNILGGNLSFAASEAYKLLRTNLTFSLADNNKCRIIGVTSALAGEGKSTTSLNLGYTMAQEGRRVLILEGDLRLPTMAKRLNIPPRPGLSNLLVGQCSGNDVIQRSGLSKNVYVITAGDVPPNPAELLSSPQMHETIKALAEVFDVIIVDLPPVSIVADALVASQYVDGMVVVVRQNYCTRRALAELMRQINFAGTKLLGFVMTGSDLQKKNYKKYGKGYNYYSHYDQAR